MADADKIPLKAIYNEDETVKSLAEFTVSDVVGVDNGGTGVSTLGNIVSGDSSVSVTGGEGVVISNVIIGFNASNVVFETANLSGILDGGSFS